MHPGAAPALVAVSGARVPAAGSIGETNGLEKRGGPVAG